MSVDDSKYLMESMSEELSEELSAGDVETKGVLKCEQLSPLSMPSNGAPIVATSLSQTALMTGTDSYSCYIDVTNVGDKSSLMLTLETPHLKRVHNVSTSPIPHLIAPNSSNSYSQNISCDEHMQNRSFLRIIEQPTNRIRYRYKSEKGSHGGLTGEHSTQTKKTYPTVKLENYEPRTQVYLRASLFTNEERPKIHVHKLMGKHCNDEGSCTLPLSENMIASFQNLGILFVGKKEVPDILYRRKIEENRILHSMVNNVSNNITDIEKQRIREESEREAKDMNLNSVKICFEAFVYENEISYPICNAIFSRPVANQKSPDSGELKIVRMDKYSGQASGDEEVFLLCEKVNKKEIKIRFFEADSEGNQVWEAFGNFTEADVHHQVAIVFRTPPYRDQNIENSVQVYLQLFRPRDGEFSEARPFTYKPKDYDSEGMERKRKKITHYSLSLGEISNSSHTNNFIDNTYSTLSEEGLDRISHEDSNIDFYELNEYFRKLSQFKV